MLTACIIPFPYTGLWILPACHSAAIPEHTVTQYSVHIHSYTHNKTLPYTSNSVLYIHITELGVIPYLYAAMCLQKMPYDLLRTSQGRGYSHVCRRTRLQRMFTKWHITRITDIRILRANVWYNVSIPLLNELVHTSDNIWRTFNI
jgi:hypothetical protein